MLFIHKGLSQKTHGIGDRVLVAVICFEHKSIQRVGRLPFICTKPRVTMPFVHHCVPRPKHGHKGTVASRQCTQGS